MVPGTHLHSPCPFEGVLCLERGETWLISAGISEEGAGGAGTTGQLLSVPLSLAQVLAPAPRVGPAAGARLLLWL